MRFVDSSGDNILQLIDSITQINIAFSTVLFFLF